LSAVVQGIVLFVVGMAFLFASMGVIILAMIVLERLFRTRKLVPEGHEPGEREAVSRHERDTADEEVVAAIALALAHLRSLDIARSGLGTVLEAGHGSWWTMGQIRQRPMPILPPPKGSTPSETSSTPQGRG
jgi:Na+-transporting methylmalonyl-CoA/oxaloacetate decarboxylase gamma subunit